MRPTEIESLLQDGIALAQAGQRHEARRILQQVIDADPHRALAWMWLATVTDEREDRIAYLERALTLDPTNATARMAYEQLTGEIFAVPVSDEITGSPVEPTRPAQSRFGVIMVGVVVLAFAMAAFIMVLLLDNADQSVSQSERMSTSTFEALLTPRPTQTPERQVSLVPTQTHTPRPTASPGPSPTSIWDAPPPTWTIEPTQPPPATWTLAPTSTANPSPVQFVAPVVQSLTAAFVQTSDAPLEARQSATAAMDQTHAAQTASSTPTPTASETFDSLRATVNARFTQAAATGTAIQSFFQTQAAVTPTAQPQ